MHSIKIPSDLLEKIFEHARKDYPSECCGFIVGPDDQASRLSRSIPCINAQDEYHTRDPLQFPRTSQNAYFVEPRQLLQIQKEIRSKGEVLRMIYHSHPNSDAVFSAEDQKMAAMNGEPVYPDVSYLVISVKQSEIAGYNVFSWDLSQRKFV